MSNVPLKPCPFCGSEAQTYNDTDGTLLVECSNEECQCNDLNFGFLPDYWNTRAQSAEVERLRSALERAEKRFKKLRKHLHDRHCVYVDETDLEECKDIIDDGRKEARAALNGGASTTTTTESKDRD